MSFFDFNEKILRIICDLKRLETVFVFFVFL